MADTLKTIIEQGDEEGIMSRTTVEWFRMSNADANQANLSLHAAVAAEVAKWATFKAETFPETKTA